MDVPEHGPKSGPGSGDAAWDAFVARCGNGSYLQASAWAAVKAPNGWSSRRVTARIPGGMIGAQVLLKRLGPMPWAIAYAPRGPVSTAWSPAAVETFTDALRTAALGRVSHVQVDPEIEAGGPLDPGGETSASFRDSGWRATTSVQPSTTRLVDLAGGEAALWSGLRKKWRQYVNKARAAGVTVRDGGQDPITAFYLIYRETAQRAGFRIRTEQAYRDVWNAFRPSGDARMLFAVDAGGTPQAALFLVRNGSRLIEPYGGMTRLGSDLRANYLLKWEAIRGAAESGAASYDMWGLVQPGIAHFKAGFGGREVRYIGGFDLVLSGLGHQVYRNAQAVRALVAHRRGGRSPTTPPGSDANRTAAQGSGESDAEDGA